MAALRLILADQLSHSLASLQDCDKSSDWILMAEVRTEASYFKHHKKKVAFLFSAMRRFAKELTEKGYQLAYTKYANKHNQ